MRAFIYDAALLKLTSMWYREVLTRLPDGARLLDVGIGTGGALCRNAELVKQKNLTIVGVDIDAAYVDRACKAVVDNDIGGQVTVKHMSIYDFHEAGFDAVYFGASFMLMPDPPAILRHVMGLLNENGRIYFTQTFEEKRSRLVELAKPLLHKITTIHFGQVTYEDDFFKVIESAGLEVLEHETLNGSRRSRTGRLIVGQPASQPTA